MKKVVIYKNEYYNVEKLEEELNKLKDIFKCERVSVHDRGNKVIIHLTIGVKYKITTFNVREQFEEYKDAGEFIDDETRANVVTVDIINHILSVNNTLEEK